MGIIVYRFLHDFLINSLVSFAMFFHLNFTYLTIISAIVLALNILWALHLYANQWYPCPVQVFYTNKSTARLPKTAPVLRNVSNQRRPIISNNNSNSSSTQPYKLAFDNINFNIGRWDNQRLYKIIDFALVGDDFSEASASSVVCLATQSSIERLPSLYQVSGQWNGPISAAIFVAGNEEFHILQYYVTYLRLCFPFVRSNVTFHVAAPRDLTPTTKASYAGNERFDCQYPEQTLKRLLTLRSVEMKRWRQKNEYPQNHMRNLARKGCQSKYVFLTDMDIIPSSNIVPLLNTFLQTATCKGSGRCAYVIPTFELDIRAKFPSTKADLYRLHKKGLARPFHEKVFIYNQYATNFSSWLANAQTNKDTAVSISHVVTNFELLYEPFYVAYDNVPPHDERFVGYGFTRNSQVYEMYVAGYIFNVLTPIFTCHWGLQQKKSRPVWREQQNNVNRKRFEKFKTEIFARYKNDPLRMFGRKLENKAKN